MGVLSGIEGTSYIPMVRSIGLLIPGTQSWAGFLWYAVLGYLHLVRSIGLLSTSSRTPQSLQSPPVRGRPGGHDGNGRPLSPASFPASSVFSSQDRRSCIGCVLHLFILLHVLCRTLTSNSPSTPTICFSVCVLLLCWCALVFSTLTGHDVPTRLRWLKSRLVKQTSSDL